MGKVMVIKLSDIRRCPKQSLSPRHYYADGSCRCSEIPAAKARLEQLSKLRKKILEQIDNEIKQLKDDIIS